MKVNVARVVATLTVCLAFATTILGQDNRFHPRIISVTGTAEIRVPPDQVILLLAVEPRDKDLAVAKANDDASIKKLE